MNKNNKDCIIYNHPNSQHFSHNHRTYTIYCLDQDSAYYSIEGIESFKIIFRFR